MKAIPCGLAIQEDYRLLAYLKVKYPDGFLFKREIKTLCRNYGKDPRTVAGLLQSLINADLIGHDEKAYYLRSWRFITGKLKINLQAFRVSVDEIRSKEIFEAKLLGAKITSIQKAYRRAAQVRKKGDSSKYTKLTNQSPATGELSRFCKISFGKVTELKRNAAKQGFIAVKKSLEDYGEGTAHSAVMLAKELPGVFLKEGRLKRRKTDEITSQIETFRIRNRRPRVLVGCGNIHFGGEKRNNCLSC